MKNDFVNDELCNKISCVAERRNFEFGAQKVCCIMELNYLTNFQTNWKIHRSFLNENC